MTQTLSGSGQTFCSLRGLSGLALSTVKVPVMQAEMYMGCWRGKTRGDAFENSCWSSRQHPWWEGQNGEAEKGLKDISFKSEKTCLSKKSKHGGWGMSAADASKRNSRNKKWKKDQSCHTIMCIWIKLITKKTNIFSKTNRVIYHREKAWFYERIPIKIGMFHLLG